MSMGVFNIFLNTLQADGHHHRRAGLGFQQELTPRRQGLHHQQIDPMYSQR